MTASTQGIYRRFLLRELFLDELRDWLALNQWGLSSEEQALADEADVALAHLDDGYGDEEYVRSRLAIVLEQRTIATVAGALRVDDQALLYPAHYQTKTAAKNKKTKLALAID